MSKQTRPQEDAEDAFIQEIENALRNDGGPGSISAPPETNEELPNRPFRFVLHHLRYYRWILISIALLELGQAACQILIPKAVQRIIDAATASGVGSTLSVWTALGGPLKLFILLNLGILIFSRSSGSALVMVGPALRRRVRHSLYRYLQGHSQRYFMGNFAGSLSNRIAEVSMSVNQSVWTVMFDFWPVAVTLCVSLVVLAQVHSGLALVLGTWSLVYVAVSYFLAIRCREYARQFAAARSAVSGKIVDAVTNVMNSKLFARNNFETGIPQPLSRPGSEDRAAHVLVHGADALVSVHRDAVASGGNDRLCRTIMDGSEHFGGFVCDGREHAPAGDQ